MKKLLTAVTVTALLSGCSSIMEGSTQQLSINTLNSVDKNNTTCKIVNDKGNWFTDGIDTTTIKKSNKDITIRCENETQEGETVLVSETKVGYMLANAIIWDLCTISCLIDHSTGALYEYPSSVQIPMRDKTSFVKNEKPVEEQTETDAN